MNINKFELYILKCIRICSNNFFFWRGKEEISSPFFHFGYALKQVALLNLYPDLTNGAEEFRTVEEPINATGPNRKTGKEKNIGFAPGPGARYSNSAKARSCDKNMFRARPRYARGNRRGGIRRRHTILDAAKKRIPRWRLFFLLLNRSPLPLACARTDTFCPHRLELTPARPRQSQSDSVNFN